MTRYHCPLCEWTYDETPQVTSADAANSISEIVSRAIRRMYDETEAAIREHLVARHTAPVMLAA